MKISNESKIGALTAIAITLLILGFNFLKGRSVVKTGNFLYAKYPDAKGLMVSNPVYVNGYQVGAVYDIVNADPNLKEIVITIKLKKKFNIPANSFAAIETTPLSPATINITLGNAAELLKSGDTITTIQSKGLLGELSEKMGPITDELTKTITNLNLTLEQVRSILDPQAKNNIQQILINLQSTTASLTKSSASLQNMLQDQTGSISITMNQVQKFSENLNTNNQKINQSLTNLEKTTGNLAQADISGTIKQLSATTQQLQTILTGLEKGEGSMGKLMQDPTLYNNLSQTVRSANILLDDLRVHPKRYVSLSVFGKKDKSGPLLQPLSDSSNLGGKQ
jgi:phospholipid/cholesterol/gamma-HCH transport system substrate-binding protein